MRTDKQCKDLAWSEGQARCQSILDDTVVFLMSFEIWKSPKLFFFFFNINNNINQQFIDTK